MKIAKLGLGSQPRFIQMAQAPACLPLPRHFPKGSVILTVGPWAASERRISVPAQNAAALASSLQHVLETPALAASLRATARERALQLFNDDTMV
jgi:hypothetical protein